MGSLDGRVAIITGAGRGIGREHALLFAAEGAKIVVNDLGGANDGTGTDLTPAQQVVEEIKALDILVNNAGILRDRVIVNMTEEEWDAVIAVHLKGHFAPTRWAAAYWREQHKAGIHKPRNLVHTSSTSGLFANPGQANYGAAKTGIATFSQIAAKELARYNVKSNTIAPAARTRLTMALSGIEHVMQPKDGAFDPWDPANISPLVVYLASANCVFNGETFLVSGGNVTLVESWARGRHVERDSKWSVGELTEALALLARS